MAKPRVTATDRLANVIEVVELGQRTGLLAVERGSGSVLEEGELYFVSGRVMYASLAGLRGREALAALSRWGPCRFAFDRDAARPAPNVSGATPAPDSPPPGWPISRPDLAGAPAGYSPPRTPSQSGFWPSQSSQSGFDQGIPGGSAGPASWASGPISPINPGAGASGMSGALPRANPTWTGNGPGSGNANGNGNSSGGYATSYPAPSNGAASGFLNPQRPGMTNVGPNTPPPGSPLGRRPRRAPDVRDLMSVVTSYGLSRNHRTILLLADGDHTVMDLVRLSSKTVDEVTALLAELEARGLVYYYG